MVRSPQKARLELWHLKRIPFPAVPIIDPFNTDPLSNGSVFAPELRKPEIEQIRHSILGEGYPDQVVRWNWLWARKHIGRNIGMGKTALLTYIADQINQDYGHKFFGHAAHWLSIYVLIQPKTRTIEELAAQALASICNGVRGTSIERLLLAKLRRKVLVLDYLGQCTPKIKTASENKFADDKWLINNGIDQQKLAIAVEQFLKAGKVSTEMAKAIATCTLGDYLIGLNGSPYLSTVAPPLLHKALSLLLNDVARIAQLSGVRRMTFLLDNFYYLVRKTPQTERMSLAARIREMVVDGQYESVHNNLYNWVAVMHTQTAPSFSAAWEDRGMHETASLKFDAKSNIFLHALPLKSGKILLETYLDSQRSKSSTVPSKSYPYTSDALDAIAEIASAQVRSEVGTCEPRGLLQAAFEVTCAALENDYPKIPIDVDFVKHVLTNNPLPDSLADTVNDEDDVAPSEEQMSIGHPCPCACHEGSEVHDVVVRLAGGTTQQDTRKILGHRCVTCNAPVSLKPESGPLNANNA